MKDVLISIKGIHDLLDDTTGAQNPVELVTKGEYSHSEDETVFSYMESEMTGMQGTKTTFRITPNIVTLQREGSTDSNMVFQRGRKHVFLYDTEYGSISMGVSTGRLFSGMTAGGGEVEIDYTLDMDSVVVSNNSFIIKIRELTDNGPARISQ